MTEYLVAHVINAERDFFLLHDTTGADQWTLRKRIGLSESDRLRIRHRVHSYRCLNQLTIGILGVGEIGRDAAMRFKVGFGCRTLGLVRSVPNQRSPHIDEYFSMSGAGGNKGLVQLLKDSDYICSMLPNTPETTGILGGGILKECAGTRQFNRERQCSQI
jgi:phosphoglycerate dehydrogenase-like enzyme